VKPLSEKAFLAQVVQLAKLRNWLCYHTHDSRHSARGFPDLVLVRPRTGGLLVAELKTDGGRLTPEQSAWLDAFAAAGVAAHVWRPRAWKLIEAELE
jgi:hypothetical protein